MLRSFLIYLSKAAWAQNLVMNWGFATRAASRFVAGSRHEDAITVVKELNAKGINATLDHLGEHTSNSDEANSAANAIIEILEEIDRSGIRSNVSIKLTQIGMGMDDQVCRENLKIILETARALNIFIRIDMEDSPYTDKTINFFNEMAALGFDQDMLGMVVQSYLYRTENDTRRLLESGTRIRLVKGAYREPPEVAYPKKVDVDANFDNVTGILLDSSSSRKSFVSSDGRIPPIPAIATHDEDRIIFAKQYAQKIGLPNECLEFQMLYGIRRDLQESLARDGYPVRVYVPFGTHWYPYFMRRLAERPANLWFILSNLFRN